MTKSKVLRCGTLALLMGFAGAGQIPSSHAQSVTFNLNDAELSTVIATIAEITGKNFIIDPRVKGKATVISSRPMTKEEAYQVFLSLLEVHGYAAVPAGEAMKIVPDVNAKQTSTPVVSGIPPGMGEEVVTKVIEVKHVAAAQLVPILRPLVPQQGHLVAYAPTNVLIISDRAANIARLENIVDRIDRPSADEEIEVVSLRHASAAEVVRIMTTLTQQEKRDPASRGAETPPVMVADERTNSILLGGNSTSRMRLRAIIAHLDTPLVSEGNTHVVYLRYAKATDLVPVLTGLGQTLEEEQQAQKGAAAAPKVGGGTGLNIQADEATNALVITGPPDVFRSLQAVIRQLDIRRAQVAVEAIIAEISSGRASELGVQWLFDGTPAGDRPVGAVNFTAGSSIADIGAAVAQGTVPPIPGGLTVGIGRFDSDTFNFAALVRALEGDRATNVLSTPSLVTLDNVEAEIKVGQVVPFVTGSYTSTGQGSTPTNPFQTVNRENVGITLKVTPQINEGDAIKLDITQEVSSIAPSQIASDIITNERSIKTTVMVEDGQLIVLGGLITDDQNESVQKVPLLGDLPLLGGLFRYKSQNKDKTNLMVFIRPRILRDAAVTTWLSNSKYDYMRAKQLEIQREGSSVIDDGASPLLPHLEHWRLEPDPPVDEPVLEGADPGSVVPGDEPPAREGTQLVPMAPGEQPSSLEGIQLKPTTTHDEQP